MFKRWWWILPVMLLGGPFLGLAVSAVVTYAMPKSYSSKAVVQIRPALPGGSPSVEEHALLMISRPEVEAVVAGMDLEKRWNTDRESAIRAVEKATKAGVIRGTSLVEVGVRYPDPMTSQDLADAIVENYRRQHAAEMIVHETATLSEVPVSPNVTLNLVAGSVGGVLLGILAALPLMFLLNKVFPPRDSALPSPA